MQSLSGPDACGVGGGRAAPTSRNEAIRYFPQCVFKCYSHSWAIKCCPSCCWIVPSAAVVCEKFLCVGEWKSCRFGYKMLSSLSGPNSVRKRIIPIPRKSAQSSSTRPHNSLNGHKPRAILYCLETSRGMHSASNAHRMAVEENQLHRHTLSNASLC